MNCRRLAPLVLLVLSVAPRAHAVGDPLPVEMRRYLATRFPQADVSRTAREVADALTGAEFPILPQRVSDLLLASEPIAFARAPVSPDAARAIAVEARAIVSDVETAWRSRRTAASKKPRKRRR